jgi:HK97 family phage prohead protease
MTAMRRRDIAFDGRVVRAEGDDDTRESLTFEGHAAVFNQVTLIGSRDWGFVEWIEKGAFSDVLDDDVRFLFNHDGMPMARTTNGTLKLSEDKVGLFSEADLAPMNLSRDLAVLIERGDVTQMSFAFYPGQTVQGRIPSKDDDEEDDRAARAAGLTKFPKGIEKFRGMPFVAHTKMDRLFDVSPVTYPAYEQTDISKVGAEMELEIRSVLSQYSDDPCGLVVPRHRGHYFKTMRSE